MGNDNGSLYRTGCIAGNHGDLRTWRVGEDRDGGAGRQRSRFAGRVLARAAARYRCDRPRSRSAVSLVAQGGDGASHGIGAAASYRHSIRRGGRTAPEGGEPPVSPRRDAVSDDACSVPCLPGRPMALEYAGQTGTRESFEPGLTLVAAVLTTEGSESLAMDTTGNGSCDGLQDLLTQPRAGVPCPPREWRLVAEGEARGNRCGKPCLTGNAPLRKERSTNAKRTGTDPITAQDKSRHDA